MNILKGNNSLTSLLRITFRHAPCLTILNVTRQIVLALIPIVNVLVVSHFIDVSINIYKNMCNRNKIYLSIAFIIGFMAVKTLLIFIIQFCINIQQIKFDSFIKRESLIYRACIDYEYVDNSDTFMLIKQVFDQLQNKINLIFSDFMDAINFVVKFLGLAVIFMNRKLYWVIALIILLIIPISSMTYKNGIKIYNFYKENFPGQLEMYHSTYILKDRRLVNERTLFGFTKEINKRWREMQFSLYQKKRRVNRSILKNRYFARLSSILFLAVVIIVLTFELYNKNLSVGLYITLLNSLTLIVDEIVISIIKWSGDYAQIKEYIVDLNTVCKYKHTIENVSLPNETVSKIHSIRFDNVSFSYPGSEKKALYHVTFEINENMHCAIVGKNGAGKSTIIKLITKLYDSYTGEIYINNKNLRDYSIAEIKSMIGIIYQDYAKYDITLRDNILIGSNQSMNSIEDNDLFHMLEMVGLDELIKNLPQNIDTLMGKLDDGGVDISGGEWQRIAIARLLMKKSNFVILDEPTAALDPIAESNLYRLFQKLNNEKTTLLISHRLGSIKTVEYIYVMDGGRIIESGNHQDLYNQKGLYYEMYREQREWYK